MLERKRDLAQQTRGDECFEVNINENPEVRVSANLGIPANRGVLVLKGRNFLIAPIAAKTAARTLSTVTHGEGRRSALMVKKGRTTPSFKQSLW